METDIDILVEFSEPVVYFHFFDVKTFIYDEVSGRQFYFIDHTLKIADTIKI